MNLKISLKQTKVGRRSRIGEAKGKIVWDGAKSVVEQVTGCCYLGSAVSIAMENVTRILRNI